jgi:hypothetical protein
VRSVYLVLTLVLLVALTVQFYLAGVGVFSNPEDRLFGLHAMNGFVLLGLGLLVLIASFFTKAGGRAIALSALPLVLVLLQPLLFMLGFSFTDETAEAPSALTTYIVSLHVLVGLGAWVVTYHLFNRARGLVSEARAAAAPAAKSESVSV